MHLFSDSVTDRRGAMTDDVVNCGFLEVMRSAHLLRQGRVC